MSFSFRRRIRNVHIILSYFVMTSRSNVLRIIDFSPCCDAQNKKAHVVAKSYWTQLSLLHFGPWLRAGLFFPTVNGVCSARFKWGKWRLEQRHYFGASCAARSSQIKPGWIYQRLWRLLVISQRSGRWKHAPDGSILSHHSRNKRGENWRKWQIWTNLIE